MYSHVITYCMKNFFMLRTLRNKNRKFCAHGNDRRNGKLSKQKQKFMRHILQRHKYENNQKRTVKHLNSAAPT